MKRPFDNERSANPIFNQIVAENEALFRCVEEWILEGWQIGEHLEPTAEQAAAALFMEADTQGDNIDEEAKAGKPETHVGYPAFLRKIAFKCLNAAGHAPGPVVVNIFGGLVQGVFSDYAVSVIVVDWDQETATEEDMVNDVTLFRWDGKIGASYECHCEPLGRLESETWYAVACALSSDPDTNPPATDVTVKSVMIQTGQTY